MLWGGRGGGIGGWGGWGRKGVGARGNGRVGNCGAEALEWGWRRVCIGWWWGKCWG